MALVVPELEKRTKAYKGIAEILYGKEENKENKEG